MKKHDDSFEQLSFFDMIKNNIETSDVSSEELFDIIGYLRLEKKKREKKEKQILEQKKREEKERREREERERKEAHVREVTCMDLPLDWDNVFNSDVRTEGVHTDSIPDGLILSLTTLGRVDIQYISSVTGADYKTVICTLKGSIYQNPDTWNECFYEGWETAEEYLSGNLMRKWKAARKANEEYNGYFSDNIKAIEKVLPPTVATEDIYITLGSPWVPTDVIDDFIKYLFGDPLRNWRYSNYKQSEEIEKRIKTTHDEITGTWEIPDKSMYNHSTAVCKTYGTDRMEALYILEKTLNMKTVAVTDVISCPANSSGKKRVVNKEETIAAIEKQQKLIKKFQQWVWTDEKRKERLEMIFENNFSCVRRRIFDGSFLTFPTMAPGIELYPYQKDAVARIIFSPNTLLAHDVGAGKTYEMIAAGQELRRMGLSNKNMYVVPNNIVGQWKNIFLTMYPNAKLLCIDPASFAPNKREKVLERIKNEDHDGIIIAYSCFERIPVSKDYYIAELKAKKELIAKTVECQGKGTSKLKKKKESVEKALAELTLSIEDMYDTVCFDELGITRLFVDEAHNFKNVTIETKIKSALGINSTGSKKCRDMMDKVHIVRF